MTVIAFDGVRVAADKQGTVGGLKVAVTKLFRHNHEVLATSGYADGGLAMVAWYKSDQNPENYPNKGLKDDDSTWLYVFAKGEHPRVYARIPVPTIIEETVYAGGAGKELAMGAMLAGATAIRAVELTCERIDGCGMGIDVMELWDPMPARPAQPANMVGGSVAPFTWGRI